SAAMPQADHSDQTTSQTERATVMAHNIEKNKITGKASIVWTGETPWHKLGQKVDGAFDAQTALSKGGLDFTVEKVGIVTADEKKAVPKRFAIRRTDTKDVLG